MTWHPDALHAHFTARLNDLEKRVQDNFSNQERLSALFHKDLDEWKKSSNEWRKLFTERERNFFPRVGGYLLTFVQVVLALLLLYSYIRGT